MIMRDTSSRPRYQEDGVLAAHLPETDPPSWNTASKARMTNAG